MKKQQDQTAKCYVVAGCRPWNRKVFDEVLAILPGRWVFLSEASELTVQRLQELRPDLIFFLHWSWKVPLDILKQFECVCFHMTDVPFGRGGSPLQHLILAGMESTKLSALRMTEEFDGGPVYMKRDMALNGSAEEIYVRSSYLAAEIVQSIVKQKPTPVPQSGTPTIFKRRTPAESQIPRFGEIKGLFDFIRMLDADGYPHAFLEHDGFRYEFRKAALDGETLTAQVKITKVNQ